MRRYLFRVVNEIQRLDIWPGALRKAALRWVGADVARGAVLFGGIDFVEGPLRLDDGAFVNRRVLIEAPGGVVIGANAQIGFGAMILTSTHEPGPSRQRGGEAITRPVVIGAGAWIGAGATVLPGVTIAPGTVVAAGSVVTADTEPDCLYAGVPAVLKKRLP